VVRIITRANKEAGSGVDAAYIAYGQDGKPYDVGLKREADLQELIRFVANTLGHSLTDVYKMNFVEFFRDFMRASEIVEQRKQMAEKWQK